MVRRWSPKPEEEVRFLCDLYFIIVYMIILISHIFKKFILQIVGILLFLIIWSMSVVILWRSIVGQYLWWIGLLVLVVVFLMWLPLWSLRTIKSALIESTGSYLVTNYQTDLTTRIVSTYTTHIAHNTKINSSLEITKKITQSFPWVIRWLVAQLIAQVPMMTEIIQTVQDFNPLDLTHDEISQRLTEKIHTTMTTHPLASTSLREVYMVPCMMVLCSIVLVLVFHFYLTLSSLLW